MASNSDGVWCDTPTTINITVLPPWWLSWWAKSVYCLLLIITGFLIYKIVITRQKYKLQIESLHERFSKQAPTGPSDVNRNVVDEAFLKKLTHLVEENLSNENFDVDLLAEKLKISRSQLNRKVKSLTNATVIEFITVIRMRKAVEYLTSGNYNIAETAYKLGFSVPNNFTRAFTKHFGKTPSKYIESLKES